MRLFEREKQRGAGGTRGLFEGDQEIDPDRFPLLLSRLSQEHTLDEHTLDEQPLSETFLYTFSPQRHEIFTRMNIISQWRNAILIRGAVC